MRGRVVSSFVALACIFVFQPQGGRAEQGAMQMVMPDALAALERMGEHLKTLKSIYPGGRDHQRGRSRL